jgi:predicted N-acetyltransferase YhbS
LGAVPAVSHHSRTSSNEAEGAPRTFVCCAGNIVIGYYSLAAASVMHSEATGRVRRNIANPVPAILLGRLAVDRAWQGYRLGADLLRDTVLRAMEAAKAVGVRAIVVHAISEETKVFYQKQGFRESPIGPMTLKITIEEARHMWGSRESR